MRSLSLVDTSLTSSLVQIPALLFLIFSVCFWAAFSNFWPNQIAPTAYPMVFLVVAMFVLLCPMPFLYPSARWWMVRSFASLFFIFRYLC